MSRLAKGSALAHVSDVTLGAFALVPPSEALNHLIRFLSTWSAHALLSNLFTLIQYTMKLITPVLLARARLQHRVGLRKEPTSSVAISFASFSGIIGDFKMLGRFWGLLPILQWMISMEKNPPPTRTLLTIERLQGWSMLAYYPLEHLYYLRAHNLSSGYHSLFHVAFPTHFEANPSESQLSCHVVLPCLGSLPHSPVCSFDGGQEVATYEEKNLRKGKGVVAEDKEDLRNKWDSFWNEVVANSANSLVALHWSLSNGLFTNDIWLSVFGFVNAVASFRSGWKVTALPAPKPGKTNDVAGSELAITNEKEDAHS
ncbi:hypothetical protein J3R83DRAFT_12046 [Lanmaoa asiatica]|nr:hypothetical protein J3R83DRAFT_12046 [Lanmaoa asiatica]